MKRALIAITALSALTACSQAPEDRGEPNGNLRENTIELSDGRTITCIVYKAGYAGGLSCDWEATR